MAWPVNGVVLRLRLPEQRAEYFLVHRPVRLFPRIAAVATPTFGFVQTWLIISFSQPRSHETRLQGRRRNCHRTITADVFYKVHSTTHIERSTGRQNFKVMSG